MGPIPEGPFLLLTGPTNGRPRWPRCCLQAPFGISSSHEQAPPLPPRLLRVHISLLFRLYEPAASERIGRQRLRGLRLLPIPLRALRPAQSRRLRRRLRSQGKDIPPRYVPRLQGDAPKDAGGAPRPGASRGGDTPRPRRARAED